MLIEVKQNSMETEKRKLFLLMNKKRRLPNIRKRQEITIEENVSANYKAIFHFLEMSAQIAEA